LACADAIGPGLALGARRRSLCAGVGALGAGDARGGSDGSPCGAGGPRGALVADCFGGGGRVGARLAQGAHSLGCQSIVCASGALGAHNGGKGGRVGAHVAAVAGGFPRGGRVLSRCARRARCGGAGARCCRVGACRAAGGCGRACGAIGARGTGAGDDSARACGPGWACLLRGGSRETPLAWVAGDGRGALGQAVRACWARCLLRQARGLAAVPGGARAALALGAEVARGTDGGGGDARVAVGVRRARLAGRLGAGGVRAHAAWGAGVCSVAVDRVSRRTACT